MAGIKGFYESLSDSSKDVFLSVANDLHASSPSGKIERLSAFMAQLKDEIDQINKRRKAIGEQLNSIEMLIGELTKYLTTHDDLESVMFKASLVNVASQLKTEIFSLKPDNKLEKKFDVARRRDFLVQRQMLATKLFDSVLKETKEKVVPVEEKKVVPAEAVKSEDVLEDVEENGKEA